MIYRTYVCEGAGLDQARESLESSLNLSFEARDSSWYSTVYFRCMASGGSTLQLCINEDFEGEPLEDAVPLKAMLLSVSSPVESDELLARLDSLTFLRRLG